MEKLVDQMEECHDSKVYTPESIAWELLVGEVDEEKKGSLLNYSMDDGIEDPITFTYEILITVFMELLFNIAKLNSYNNNDDDTEFIPDYDKFDMNSFCAVIGDKLNLLGYSLLVQDDEIADFADDKEHLKEIIDGRYCRVVLRYHDNDTHFEDNNVSDDIFYHMKLNGLSDVKYEKLKDVYSVVFLNGKIYRISFEKL